jgi:hypothetical protein
MTPLLDMLVDDFVKRYNIGYDEAIDRLYRSELFRRMQDPSRNTYRTWAPEDLLDEYERIG